MEKQFIFSFSIISPHKYHERQDCFESKIKTANNINKREFKLNE